MDLFPVPMDDRMGSPLPWLGDQGQLGADGVDGVDDVIRLHRAGGKDLPEVFREHKALLVKTEHSGFMSAIFSFITSVFFLSHSA